MGHRDGERQNLGESRVRHSLTQNGEPTGASYFRDPIGNPLQSNVTRAASFDVVTAKVRCDTRCPWLGTDEPCLPVAARIRCGPQYVSTQNGSTGANYSTQPLISMV